MSRLAASPDPASNVAEYTVAEISGALKRTVEETFGQVRVRGEISGFRGRHSSGHAYFALKDEKARLEAVIWRTTFAGLEFKPEEGLEVIVTGRLTTYPGSSKYQIVIEELKPAGAGALMALLNERRERLQAEGLFAPERKRPLPFMPRVIGIVTSPTGAVIRDICHRIEDRFPVHLIVWPVRVQGETSGAEVASAIAGFNELADDGPVPRPDLIIVARGGGSLEDLWGFNDEAVVRAAAASAIPLISAVGHETDWTLIDHAADARAPTPTGAAEMAVPVCSELRAQIAACHARHQVAVSRNLSERRRTVTSLARALPAAEMLLALPRRRLDESSTGLERAVRALAAERRHRYGTIAGRLDIFRLEGLLRQKRGELRHFETQGIHALERILSRRRQALLRVSAHLRPQVVESRSASARERLNTSALTLGASVERSLRERRTVLAAAWRVAESLAPQRVLERGYAIVHAGEDDRPITRAGQLQDGMAIEIEFAGGERRSALAGPGEAKVSPTPRTSQRQRPRAADTQGDLF